MINTSYLTSILLNQELIQLASNVKLARKRRKITLLDMAQRTSSSVATISRLEAGDPKVALETFLRALEVLGLLKGLSEFISPEADTAQVLEEVRQMRMGNRNTKGKIFKPNELDF
jgi:transcriptional regulator with XRE-family HTH domain